jgi:branched-chain amino acid transport system permease protein
MTAVAEQVRPAAPARFRPSVAGWCFRIAVGLLAFAVVAWGPLYSDELTRNVARAAAYAMIALSLNVLIGYTGQVSLGHQGFVGLGALTAANIVTKYELPFAVSILGAVLAGALAAMLLGFVALRITGLYLALITLVFGITMASSVFQFQALNGRGAGVNANRPAVISSEIRYYWFCLLFVALVVYVDRQLTKSKTGRALLALKENERVAAAFGVNVTKYKLVAFLLSGAVAGLAGSLLVFHSQQFASQDYSNQSFALALLFVVMTVVGGLGSRTGAVLGGAFFALFRDPLLPMLYRTLHWALFDVPIVNKIYTPVGLFVADAVGGLLLIVTLVFQPRGMATIADPIVRWVTGKRFELHDAEAGPAAVEGSSVRA